MWKDRTRSIGNTAQKGNEKNKVHTLAPIINGNPLPTSRNENLKKRSKEHNAHLILNTAINIGDPNDVRDAVPYENVIYISLRQNELDIPLQPFKSKILLANRNIVIDSISHMISRLEYSTNCMYVAIGLLNRFLSTRCISMRQLKIFSFAAVFAASKIEEVSPHSGQTLIREGNYCFQSKEKVTCSELFNAEIELLNSINFSCTEGTPLFFLTHHLRIIKANKKSALLSRYILELIQTDDRFLMINPSKQAAVAQIAAHAMRGEERWPKVLAEYTGYDEADLSKPLKWIRRDLLEKDRQASFFITWKYSTETFECVSSIPVPSSFK